MIEGILDRLARVSGTPKDAEAQALIAERTRMLPDALYCLVQAVAVQDVSLRQAQARIAELESRAAQAPAPSAGFLGAAANPWAASSPGPRPVAGSVPPVAPPQAAYAPQYAPPSAAGGFLRQAAVTATGMAGGMLLAEGISSLFSGGHGGMGSPWGGGGQPQVVENTTVNNYYDGASPDNGGVGDAGFDDSDSSGGDFSGGDDGSWI